MWGYKGLDVLLRSLKTIRENINDFILVIAGQPLDSWKIYYKIIEENRLDNNILKILKYIPDSEIEYYFTSADLVPVNDTDVLVKG